MNRANLAPLVAAGADAAALGAGLYRADDMAAEVVALRGVAAGRPRERVARPDRLAVVRPSFPEHLQALAEAGCEIVPNAHGRAYAAAELLDTLPSWTRS